MHLQELSFNAVLLYWSMQHTRYPMNNGNSSKSSIPTAIAAIILGILCSKGLCSNEQEIRGKAHLVQDTHTLRQIQFISKHRLIVN